MAEVLDLLRQMPPWTEFHAGDESQREVIEEYLSRIAVYELPVIRKSFREFQQQNGDSVGQMSKIFVANRYLFAIPNEVNLNENKFFGGWVGVPMNAGKVRVVWPFERRGETLRLVGTFGGYAGDAYLGVDEFDYFLRKYGKRIHAK